jgi:hypothetical protein
MGSFRLFRSKTIAPGVRVNLTKSGVGLSLGSKFFRVSQHSTGSSTRSVSLPGTGFQWRDQRKSAPSATKKPSQQRASRPGATTETQAAARHASVSAMLAANADTTARIVGERAVFKAASTGNMWLLLGLHEQLVDEPKARDAALIAAVLLAVEMHQPQVVAAQLQAELPDLNAPVIHTLTRGQVPMPVTPGIDVVMDGAVAAGYALVYALNRCRYYTTVSDLFTIDDLQDDMAALFAVELARALTGLRRFATAKETLARVIRRTRFARVIRSAALEQRCIANMGLGERAAARRDLERFSDLSPEFPTIERLTQLVG